jgi:hypothetical protein
MNFNCILTLLKEYLPLSLPNFQTQEVMHHADVLHLKLNCHVCFSLFNELLCTCKKQVIYI